MEKAGIDKYCGLLVIGGSAGSLEVVLPLLSELPVVLAFPVIIVLHRKSTGDSALEELIRAKTSYTVREVEDKDALIDGIIYIAPPDYHLLIERDLTLALDMSEKQLYSRPSIDVTFESAADVLGNQLVCILLSGANADGAEGLKTVKELGGLTIVQDPATAVVGFMPQQAIDKQSPDIVASPEELKDIIVSLNKHRKMGNN